MPKKNPDRLINVRLRTVQLGASTRVFHWTAASHRNKRGETVCGLEGDFHAFAPAAARLCLRCRAMLEARDKRRAQLRRANG